MTDPSSKQQQVTPGKLVLVAVLAVVLVTALMNPPDESSSDADQFEAESPTTLTTNSDAAVIADTEPSRGSDLNLSLETILEYDPFQRTEPPKAPVPAPLPEQPPVPSAEVLAERARDEENKARLQRASLLRVWAVYQTDAGMVALIDDQPVYEGTILQNGLQVIHIRPNGVTLGLAALPDDDE